MTMGSTSSMLFVLTFYSKLLSLTMPKMRRLAVGSWDRRTDRQTDDGRVATKLNTLLRSCGSYPRRSFLDVAIDECYRRVKTWWCGDCCALPLSVKCPTSPSPVLSSSSKDWPPTTACPSGCVPSTPSRCSSPALEKNTRHWNSSTSVGCLRENISGISSLLESFLRSTPNRSTTSSLVT